jgi:hypothetical protein
MEAPPKSNGERDILGCCPAQAGTGCLSRQKRCCAGIET